MRAHVAAARGIALATSWRMLRNLGAVALLAASLNGCASVSEQPPATTPQADCERNNGAWRAVLNFCEHC